MEPVSGNGSSGKDNACFRERPRGFGRGRDGGAAGLRKVPAGRSGAEEINSKLEIRNSKQTQMNQQIPNQVVLNFEFEYSTLFRISSFGFRILLGAPFDFAQDRPGAINFFLEVFLLSI
jgi:hypothetical protein